MKNRIFTVKNWLLRKQNLLLAGILTLTGLPWGCDKINLGTTEYGQPHATYIVKGTLKKKSDNTPVTHVVARLYAQSYKTDSVQITGTGEFTVRCTEFPNDIQLKLKLTDLDAARKFKEIDTVITFLKSDLKGGDGKWYHGEQTKQVNIIIPDLK